MTRQRKPHTRWQGVVGIGDRVAFKMPGDDYITAGTVEEVDEHTALLSNLACIHEDRTRRTTTLRVQRGLIIENKSELSRQDTRQQRKESVDESTRVGE